MRKRPKIKYTDMCIYIDNNINKPDADATTIYEYLVMISYMLSVKRRFFNREDQYDQFAHYFATLVYNRMTDKRQFLDKTSKDYVEPIHSCLNYMKHIIYARKCEFCRDEYGYTPSESDIEALSKGRELIYPASSSVDELIRVEVDEYFTTIDRIVKDVVYNGVYGKDKVLC